MILSKLPDWFFDLRVIGAEDDEDDPYERDADGAIVEEDGEQVLREGWELNDKGEAVKVDDGGDDLDDIEGDDDLAKEKKKSQALEKALTDERREKRRLEREAKKAKRDRDKNKDKKDEEDSAAKLQASEAKTERLAKGLLNSKRDSAILEAARKLGFIDETDALTDDIRNEVDFDQDDEDPSEIDIDLDSVKDAVKSLADRKKHLVGKGTPKEKSGGRFGGKSNKDDGPMSEQALKDQYASLR